MIIQPGHLLLGRYVVERVLGEGGMGRVYLGTHQELGYPVALKVLSDVASHLAARFDREARLMARVRHPNVVTIFDYGRTPEGLPCIAMEFVDGESVHARMERSGALPWTEAAGLAVGMFQGLEAMHSLSVLHRDIKPSNVLVAWGEPETVKLIDFGISRPTEADATRYTGRGFVVGTPAFMAPELWLGRDPDARADLYAAGLILHYMLTGVALFGGDEPVARRTTVPIQRPVAAPGQPKLPEALVAAVMSLLAIDPGSRPRTAAEAAGLLGGLSPIAEEAEPPPCRPDPSPGEATRALPFHDAPTVVARRGARAPLLVAAFIPPSRLGCPDDRAWLDNLAGPDGRTMTVGSAFWFATLPMEDPGRAEDAARGVRDQVLQRYRSLARVAWRLAEDDFPASFTVEPGAPMRPELQDLIARLMK